MCPLSIRRNHTVFRGYQVPTRLRFPRWFGRDRRLLAHDVDAAAVEKITAQYAFGPLLYLVCFGLAWVSVSASLIVNIALACFFALPPSFVRRERPADRQ
jgi:hypothetical protein